MAPTITTCPDEHHLMINPCLLNAKSYVKGIFTPGQIMYVLFGICS